MKGLNEVKVALEFSRVTSVHDFKSTFLIREILQCSVTSVLSMDSGDVSYSWNRQIGIRIYVSSNMSERFR